MVLSPTELEFLGEMPLFAGMRSEVLEHIGQQVTRIDIAEDRWLFREGQPAKEMMVVLDGELDIVKETTSGGQVCIATLGPGDVAGEMSLFDIQPRSANVWVRAPASLAALEHGALARLYRCDQQSYTLLVLNIAREISIRLRRLDSTLADMMGHVHAVARMSS